jgi:hypothetical protein
MPDADLGSTQGNASTSALVEHWMMDPNLGTLSEPWHNLKDWIPDNKKFSLRLQTAINTFWDATIGSQMRLSNLLSTGMTTTWNATETQITEIKGKVYVCNVTLAAITIVISLLLFVAANLSMLLGLFTRTPDILGFVSTATRDNPYFRRHVTSHVNGLETTRALYDVRVRIGDVSNDANVGHIALATLDSKPKRLSWTKLYD